MNIIFVTQALPYLPCRDGFRLYAANLVRSLGKRHRIDMISLLQEDDRDHLSWAKEHCSSLMTLPLNRQRNLMTPINLFSTFAWGKPLAHRKRISCALNGGAWMRRWDVVHVEGGYAGGLIPEHLPTPRILSLHDSCILRSAQMAKCSPTRRERLYYRLLNRIQPRYERLVFPRFDCCVLVGGADAHAVREVAPNCQVAVVPNGIDTDYYRPMPAKAGESTFVFHGNLEYAPNIHAAMEFAREIFPMIRKHVPQAVFHLVGARPAKQIRELASSPGIKLSADLPDLRHALGNSHVYVCPLRFGTGVKNKLLEAMALGLPIICYPEAVRGIDCVSGTHLLSAEDPSEFTRLALNLIGSPRRREELGQAARQLVEESFSWDSRAGQFERLYRGAIESRFGRSGQRCPSPQETGEQVLAM